MSVRTIASMFVLAVGLGVATLWGAAVSRQQADAFARKIEVIQKRGATSGVRKTTTTPQRTPVSESEINSWFTYRAGSVLPEGLTQPSLTIVGNGQVTGNATVDLDAVSRSRTSGRTFDLWSLVGGQVPVTIGGIIRTQNGHARFELQDAAIRGIPVPRRVVQELVAYYSKTPEHPDGHRLDEDFELPAGIQTIEITPGAAVVIQ
jgi:hypothetical protein